MMICSSVSNQWQFWLLARFSKGSANALRSWFASVVSLLQMIHGRICSSYSAPFLLMTWMTKSYFQRVGVDGRGIGAGPKQYDLRSKSSIRLRRKWSPDGRK
ncbi:hypothetical protein ACLOJK_022343 [Asimina triloba]